MYNVYTKYQQPPIVTKNDVPCSNGGNFCKWMMQHDSVLSAIEDGDFLLCLCANEKAIITYWCGIVGISEVCQSLYTSSHFFSDGWCKTRIYYEFRCNK